jgi:hypothetical protein
MIKLHLRANWASAVSESFEYRTTIFTTSGGREQRSAERSTPRREVKFLSLMSQNAMRNMQALMDRKGVELLQIADPIRTSQILGQSLTAGQTIIPLDLIPAWLEAGVDIAFVEPNKTVFATVLSVASNSCTLVSGLSKAVALGAEMRLAITGYMGDRSTMTAATDAVASFPIVFEQAIGMPVPPMAAAALQTFESRPVLTVGPNWQRGASATFESAVDKVDFERGLVKRFLRHDILNRIAQFDYLGRGADSIGSLIALFAACKGRQGEFWCPTWLEDMIPSSGITVGETEIAVEGRYLADFYAASKINKAIAIRLSDGSWVFRRVTGITVNGLNPGEFTNDFSDDFKNGESIISVDSPFTTTAEAGSDYSTIQFITPLNVSATRLEIVGVYWLHLCRFASDQLSVQWITDDVGQATAQVITLEYFAPEVL